MGKWLTVLLQFAFVTLAQAQFVNFSAGYKVEVRNIDSLHRQLTHVKADAARIDLLNLLAREYYHLNNNDSLGYYAKLAQEESQKIKYQNGAFVARVWLVEWLVRVGDYPTALQIGLQLLQEAENANDPLLAFWANREITLVYFLADDYAMMLHYTDKILQLLNSTYFKNKDEKDKVFYQLIGCSTQRGNAFDGVNRLDSSFYYRMMAYKEALFLKNNDALALTTINLARQYLSMKNIDSASYFFRTSIAYSRAAGVRVDRVSSAYLHLARIFELKNQPDSALYYGRLSLNSIKGRYPSFELAAASFLNNLYAKQGRVDSAYRYLTLASLLKDSLYSAEKLKQFQSYGFGETLRQQQVETAKKEVQQRYQTSIKIYSLVVGLAVLLLVAFFLYRNNRQKQKANLVLYQKNVQVENTLGELKATQAQLIQSEKMASLGELTAGIAHEIQNPLNFVNNFSDVNKELLTELKDEADNGNIDEVKAIANDVIDNEEKINHHGKRADAIVKGMLQHSRVSTGKKEPTDINALADEYLRLSYHGLRAKDKEFNADLTRDFDGSIGKIEVVPPDIGRVLLNLYNNAFQAVAEKKKHQGDGYLPTVKVATKRLGDKIEIIVSDNGTGIPDKIVDKIFQPFFTTKPTGQGTGLGLSLSYDIIKAHGGELKVETKVGEGAEFIVSIPSKGV